ncbi:PTS sugar transporter subunit IIC [Oenococcus sp.]|uniref:PTS sugar transporter subunit IIC n=1 Tax=Oenococcus sp. TaxID=1979414 RepID=UPI0039E8F825
MKEQKNFMTRVTDLTIKISDPLAKFSNTNEISAIIAGLIAAMPIIMIGSLFLIVYVLGSPSIGTSGKALIPFLAPLAGKFSWMNSLTLGLMALYCSSSISESYASKLKMNQKTAGLIGMGTFIVFTLSGLDKSGGFNVVSWSASGLFVAIITSLVSVRILKFCLDKNLTIRMPEGVPPAVGDAFGALIPYGISFSLAWLVRTIMGFDMVTFLNNLLRPIVSGSDNVWVAMGAALIVSILWSVGLHGDNMFLVLFTPFGLQWLNQNSNALNKGVSVDNLPHVLAGVGQTGLLRLTMWTAAIWPLILLMIMSKNAYLKKFGWTTLAPGIFTITEPVIYGLPLALNPYLMIPFIISSTVSTGVGYLIMSTPWFGKFFALIPWATPPFLLGPLGTGDWKTALIPVISFAIGFIIYIPFWRAYVASLDAEAAKKEPTLAA